MQAPHAQAHASAPQRPADEAPRQYLRLGVGHEMFATSIDAVREILEFGQLTPLPQTPPFVRGVMNLRGAVVPVIDIGARFGGDAAEVGRRTCIVVVEIDAEQDDTQDDDRPAPSHVVGMLVDAVYEVFEVAAVELEPVPPMGTSVAPEFLRAIARVRGQACAVLDLDHLLAQGTLADLIAGHPTIS
jgi:purine-binding chemotaxis protein CheW